MLFQTNSKLLFLGGEIVVKFYLMKSVFIKADWNPLMIGKQDILHWLDFLLPFLLQLLQFFYERGRGARKYNAWRSFAHFKHCKKKKDLGTRKLFLKC